jgi:ribonuclease BN (tRNA processing enzyme)
VRLTVIGCAGSAPGPDSACSAYLIEHENYRLLLDLGAGAAGPLQRHAEPAAIDAVVLSHAHPDHYGDLTQLWRLRMAAGAPPLPVIGPSDLPDALRDPDAFALTVARAGPLTLGPLDVSLVRVEHGECWATRIGDAFCYTADTEPCAALDEAAGLAGCPVVLAHPGLRVAL